MFRMLVGTIFVLDTMPLTLYRPLRDAYRCLRSLNNAVPRPPTQITPQERASL